MRMTEHAASSRSCWRSVDHPDVEELYLRCVALDDKISISTVYLTVNCSRTSHIERTISAKGRARYEQMRDSHHDTLSIFATQGDRIHSEDIEKLQGRDRRSSAKLVDPASSFIASRSTTIRDLIASNLYEASTSSFSIVTACWSTAKRIFVPRARPS